MRLLQFATVAVATLISASAAHAAKVTVFTRAGTVTDVAPGKAEAHYSDVPQLVGGLAEEGTGRVSLKVSATSDSRNGSDNIPQVSASAASSDVFQLGLADGAVDIGNGVYTITALVRASGDLGVGQGPAPNGVTMDAQAKYDFNFNVGGQAGAGSVDLTLFEGTATRTVTGLGDGGLFPILLTLRLMDRTSINLAANAFAAAPSYGGGTSSAFVDFSHTLAWSGVSRVQYRNDAGDLVDAPSDFRLSLLSDDTGFDYWNAAPTPDAVPEPATWAMMLLGFGAAGAALRRRAAVS